MQQQPKQFEEWKSDFHLTFYRILLLTIIIGMPSIAILYKIIGLESGVLPVYRLVAVLLAGLILIGSYRFERLRRRLEYVMYGVFLLLTVITIQICEFHHFKPQLAIGLIVMMALCGLGFQKPSYLLAYYCYCIVHLILLGFFGNIPTDTLLMLLLGTVILMAVMNFFLRDRNRLLSTLVERTQEANKASELKSRFLANMSHEIRTPLNAILGMLKLTLDDGTLSGTDRGNIQIAQNSSHVLLSLINEILDFSKIEAGELDVIMEPLDPHKLCERVTELYRPAFDEANVSLISKISPKVPRQIYSDQHRVFQILSNLLNNAQKFTPKGGQVILHLSVLSEDNTMPRLSFEVHDSGIGLSDDDAKLIFQPFRQVDSSYSRPFGGSGLGLPISAQLAELIGGSIHLKSTLGKGSTFTLLLPLDNANESSLPTQPKQQTGLAQQNVSSSLYVLVAEDNLVNQKLMANVLTRRGHRVCLASNGAEAVERFIEEDFDIVLMDIQMPVLDGLQAAMKIREHEKKSASISRTPIIAITAHAFSGDKEQCLAAGMDAYISKPLDFDEFYQMLNSFSSGNETTLSMPS